MALFCRPASALTEVLNLDVTPVAFQIFGNEPPVTMMGFVFTAEQASIVNNVWIDVSFDFALRH